MPDGRATAPVPALLVLIALLTSPGRSAAQELFGQVFDQSNGQPVHTAGVFLLDASRTQVAVAIADSLGRYALRAPSGGQYYLYVQRIGYYETESPLVAIEDEGRYGVDLEIRPEPIAMDPLLVTVRNEQLFEWMRLRFGENPMQFFGTRVIQGVRLEEAKLKSDDNTELMRWLYIDSWNGATAQDTGDSGRACMGPRGTKAERGTMKLIHAPCGKVVVDDVPYPAEHLDSFDMESIAVVMTIGADVWLFTRGFDWNRRPAPGR